MDDLVGYWTDGALHGGHSSWAFAFKADGTGFSEFVNFFLVHYRPIRWSVVGGRLEITSEVEYVIDGETREFAPEPSPFRAVVPFKIESEHVAGGPMRMLSFDFANADAPDFTKRYAPMRYGFLPHVRVDAGYHPR